MCAIKRARNCVSEIESLRKEKFHAQLFITVGRNFFLLSLYFFRLRLRCWRACLVFYSWLEEVFSLPTLPHDRFFVSFLFHLLMRKH